VRTLEELDEMLRLVDEAGRVSDDELRRAFNTFRMELDVNLPPDPHSEEYRLAVVDLYEWLHGSRYEVGNERTDFELERFVDVPFPYSTHSGVTVGNHLMAIGHLLRTLDLPPSSRVLEFGSGWGNTTVALAQMGHRVTAVDVSPEFIDLLGARAAQVNAAIETVLGDFSRVDDLDGPFDAVVFFESFHHCTRHAELMASLGRVVAPGGRVFFAAEPIEEHYYAPWGLRLDGESLWAIRRNGWFELGFRRSYFIEALRRAGWSGHEVKCPEPAGATVWVAERSGRPAGRWRKG
jgi:2-polyprenyl-3-methyl-5-hydroxy-6-metoxy-1,4-benzoquinol methylase